ncbi:M23 family metallopeptidase [bacterium]|nr:M23 family metallopeptidase [candidate division CSSED10-310 bacterium]
MRKGRWIFCLSVLGVMLGIAVGFVNRDRNETAKPVTGMIRSMPVQMLPAVPTPGNRRVIGDTLHHGETLSTLLERHDMSATEIHSLAEALEKVVSLRKIRDGTSVIVYRTGSMGPVVKLEIIHGLSSKIVAEKSDGDWMVVESDRVLFTRMNDASGTITESLWSSARDQGIPPETILDLADMFGWQVDFTSGLRQNDAYQLAYQTQVIRDGGQIPGSILAARFVNDGQTFWSFRYELPDGRIDCFDESGQATRRSFLKSPLRYRYISSGFSRSRYHPILKIHRPHLGIDYAAPSGTPVSALGDGVVIYCGWKGGYGKFIEIRHGDAYETCYGHLSGYANGIRKGVAVNQGQIIGYVGSTGLSTGPHLDFRVRHRGNFINPASVKSEPADPVPPDVRLDYQAYCAAWMQRLNP